MVATLNKEDNERSETGGDDRNPDWLEKRSQKIEIGGPGGTGSSATVSKPKSGASKQMPIHNYTEVQQPDMNVSMASRKRKNNQHLEQAMPVDGKSKACADCSIF